MCKNVVHVWFIPGALLVFETVRIPDARDNGRESEVNAQGRFLVCHVLAVLRRFFFYWDMEADK